MSQSEAEVVLMGDPRVAAVPVEECEEDLVDVRTAAGLAAVTEDEAGHRLHTLVRRSLAERLRHARLALPDGLGLLLTEGYRPAALQERYFTRHRRRLEAADPTLTPDASYLAASRFVSPPSVAPHVSGAAVDVTLVDADGAQLDMGTPVDASPEDSDGACYFAAPNISAEARARRAILAAALEGAGLVNYPTEWWHWSYGDRYWALATGRPHAFYGPVDSGLRPVALSSG